MQTINIQKTQWIQVLEASVCELHKLSLQSIQCSDLSTYVQVLIAYHESSLERLRLYSSHQWECQLLKVICELRLGIREKSLPPEKLLALADFVQSQPAMSVLDEVLKAEAYFVLGFASESVADLTRAIQYYDEAAKIFTQYSAEKKALKALFNSLACKSRSTAAGRYLSDCYFVIREASRLGESSVESMARHNLSYELLKLGATEEALHEALLALELCRDHFANFNELQIRLHLADIYFQIGDYSEAKRHLNFVKITEFPESMEALKYLENTYLNAQHIVDPSKMTFNWQKRVLKKQTSLSFKKEKSSLEELKLSSLESRCLKQLAEGPIDKHRLLEKIYGNKGNFFSLENRLKVLLNRLRKKIPNEIHFFKGQYFLKDKSLRSILIIVSLVASTLLKAANSFPDIDSSLVRVCSQYFNAPAPICGVGTYVQKESKFFVLTSAHVSHGDLGLSVALIGNSKEHLSVISRASNTSADVDLLEVQAHPLLKALFVWDSYYDAFVVPDLEKWNWHFLIGRSKMEDAPSPMWLHNLGWTSALILPSQDQRVSPLKGEEFYEQFYPAQVGFENRRSFSKSLDPYESLIRFNLLSGMSGAPVITSVAQPFHVRLSSIATRAHRYSPLSYFALLDGVLPSLLKGKSLRKQPRWKFSEGLLCRSTEDGTREASLIVKERGDWGSADGGDWGSADGGEGSGQAKQSLKFMYKGESILGWKVAVSRKQSVFFHGSFSNYRSLERENLLKKATPISLGSKLVFDPYQRTELLLVNGSGDRLSFKDNKVTVKLDREKISFTLNEQGALSGSVFHPIIRVGGRVIDITELYFLEASFRRLLSGEELQASFTTNALRFSMQKRVLIGNRIVSWQLAL